MCLFRILLQTSWTYSHSYIFKYKSILLIHYYNLFNIYLISLLSVYHKRIVKFLINEIYPCSIYVKFNCTLMLMDAGKTKQKLKKLLNT